MQVLILLKSGISPNVVAKKCVEIFMRAHEGEGLTFKWLTISFAEECLRAIGFECTIDPEDIISRHKILWPENIHTYTFKYNALLLKPFELFLINFCEEFHKIKSTMNTVDNERDDVTPNECPLVLLVQIIVVSYNIFMDLQSQEYQKNFKQFEEPIARLTFHLLLGIYPLRKLYRDKLSLLDKLCDQLYKKAALGMRYPRTYLTIIEGILDIFEKDFFMFYASSKDVIYFYYNVLSLEVKSSDALIMTLNSLKKIITECTINNDDEVQNEIPSSRKIIILTDFLISLQMQRVYYTILKSRKTFQLLACLDFLNVLQNSVLSLDCFNSNFIEGIQKLVMYKNPAISAAASEVYMKMMIKKTTTGEIIKHIITFYLSKTREFYNLEHYVKALFPYFSRDMCVADYYIVIIKETDKNRWQHLLAVKFSLAVFREILIHNEIRSRYMSDIVNKIPSLLTMERCCYAKNLYLGFYNALFSYRRLPKSLKHIIYADMEKFTSEEFNCQTPHYTYSYIHNVFSMYILCLKYSKHLDHIDITNGNYFRQWDQVENQLQILRNENKEPSSDIILTYREVLLKINLLLKNGCDVCTDFIFLKLYYQKLWLRFSDPWQISAYAQETRTFLDIYACEVLTLLLTHIAQIDNPSEYCLTWLIAETQKLYDLLIQHLADACEQPQRHFNWQKTLVVCICGLIYKFGNPNRISGLKCEIKHYHNLVNSIIMLTFKYPKVKAKFPAMEIEHCEQLQFSQKRLQAYQKEILCNLIKFHGANGIEPISLSIWKICIFFGQNTHSFDEELEALLKTIALYHFEMYKRIVAVSIYNLTKRFDAAIIKRILIKHKTFIESKLIQYDTKCLRIHIVVLVVQHVKKTFETLQFNHINRMRPLEHLNILLDDLELNIEIMLDVFQLFASLQKLTNLKSEEKNSLMKFLKPYENQIMNIDYITPRKRGGKSHIGIIN